MWDGSGNATPRAWRLALAAGAAALYLVGLGGTDLWAPDEPRYAHVAAELFALDQFENQRLDPAVFLESVDGTEVRVVQGGQHLRLACPRGGVEQPRKLNRSWPVC